jgi:hypothetical protein
MLLQRAYIERVAAGEAGGEVRHGEEEGEKEACRGQTMSAHSAASFFFCAEAHFNCLAVLSLIDL